MKNEILSNNVIVKSFSLFFMMLFSINAMSQESTFDIGYDDFKVYSWNCSDEGIIIHSANKLKYIVNYKNGDYSYFDYWNIPYVINNSFIEFDFSTSHGNFVEFQEINHTNYHKILCPQIMWDGISTYYSIVQDGSNLYVVNLLNDAIINTLATSFTKGDDFKIIKNENSVYIINNGIINCYNNIYKSSASSSSSVSSPKADKSETKTYSLEGIQVNSPHNGIFIKGGKKVIIK